MINIESSVLKRFDKSASEVRKELKESGFEDTGAVLDGRLAYHENAGVNLTTLDGPFGTLVFPSGPIRGALFGKSAVGISKGEEKKEDSSTSESTSQNSRGRVGNEQFNV